MLNNAKFYTSVIEMKNKGVRIPPSSHQFDFKQDVLGNAQFYNSTYARSCRGIFNVNHTVGILVFSFLSWKRCSNYTLLYIVLRFCSLSMKLFSSQIVAFRIFRSLYLFSKYCSSLEFTNNPILGLGKKDLPSTSFIPTLYQSFISSFVHPFIHKRIISFNVIHLFAHSSVFYSFIHSFIHSFI